MSTCLGIYVEDNLIKYAKVSKDNDTIKVDSFNMKFYDKLDQALEQIIEETYSYRIPISINLSNERYNYFKIFSMLTKKDIKSIIDTEFESVCYDKAENKDGFETRYILVNDLEDKEKIKVIHVSANKADLARKISKLEKNKVSAITPIGISIANLLEFKANENILIVNIEDKTTVTTVLDKTIYSVETLEEGSAQILDKINSKENSYLKAYNICKSTTLYTSEASDLTMNEENDYLDEIMPTLYDIAGKIRKIINESAKKIDKVYITGTAASINNIDIYFQDYLKDTKCEILKPYFLENYVTKVNIKDYIEVNSAIALALQGLNQGINEINFKAESKFQKIMELLNVEVGSKKDKPEKEGKSKLNFDIDFKAKLDAGEKATLRTISGLLLLIIVYTAGTAFINNEINKKADEVLLATKNEETQINNIKNDKSKVDSKANEYEKRIKNLENISQTVAENSKTKNAIPTLLNQIMYVIPKNVQLTSISNPSGTHIVITAEAKQYEQLGYFKAILKTENILDNVVSDSAVKENNVVKVTIEGDLV